MPEHVHEFHLIFNALDHTAKDLHEAHCFCGEIVAKTEIERRLNATEMLSAEDATELAISARAAGSITDQQLADKADAYAATLGQDAGQR